MWGMSAEATGGEDAEVLNSGFRLIFMANYLNYPLLFLLPTIVGAALSRDYQSRMYTVLFSYPLTKGDYLPAKFGAAMLIAGLIVCGIGLGFALGALMPGIPEGVVVPFSPLNYGVLFGLFLFPNLLLFGALVFRVVVGTRNVYLAFISIILVVMFQALASSFFGGGETDWLVGLLDPTGVSAVKEGVRGWTIAERNGRMVPFTALLLANRALWGGVALGLCWSAWRTFSFSQFGRTASSKKPEVVGGQKQAQAERPLVGLHYGTRTGLRTAWSLSTIDFWWIARSWPFVALLLTGFVLVFVQQSQMNPQNGFEIQPTTATMLAIPMFIFSFVINLVTFLYAGLLAHRGRSTGMGDLIDATPQPDWVLLLSRLLAVLKVQLLLLLVVLVAGVVTQAINGYFRFEIGHYVFELFCLHFVHFLIWACAATFVYNLLRNLYLGFFVMVLLPSAVGLFGEFGKQLGWSWMQAGVFKFNSVPGVDIGFPFSDFFGYGPGLAYFAAFKGYWLLGGLLLLGGSLYLWRRGYVFSWRERWMQRKLEGKVLQPAMLTCGLAFLGLGATLFHHDHIGQHRTIDEATYDAFLVRNEQEFGRYAGLLQPRLAKAKINLALYPEDLAYKANGTLWFANRTSEALDTVLLASSLKDVGEYTVRNPHQVLKDDEELHYQLLLLDKPLLSGDSLRLDFEVQNAPNGLLHSNDRVKPNGTYLLGYHILPTLGVREAYLSNAKKRAKYGLGERTVRELLPTDTTLLGYSYSGNNMGRIDYETTVSTAADQEVFSEGNLVRQWQEDGRNYFHYRSAAPIVNNISWLSGRYETVRDTAAKMPLTFQYLPEHSQNIEHIRHGVRSGVAYFSALFGELEHDQLQMVEYPNNYGSHATLNANLIPYSESMLLCDVDHTNNEVFNVPFFTGAHEVAHYWWGHRVDPANVKGGRMITEGLSDYLALKVTEREYGAEFAQGVLRFFQKRYFAVRKGRGGEVPLIVAGEKQEFLNYRKAALAYHALSCYLGEDAFHTALADFEDRYRFAPPPFATSLDLVAALRAATPDSLQYLITDYFETITLYDNRLDEVVVGPANDGRYPVSFDLQTIKYRANASGKRTYEDAAGSSITEGVLASLPLADYVEVGFYAGERLLALKRLRISAINTHVGVELSERPDKVVLDPNFLLLDQERADGVWEE